MADDNTAKNISLIEQPRLILHDIQKQELDKKEFLEQIRFLYKNIKDKEQYYIKMMNKYEYLSFGGILVI